MRIGSHQGRELEGRWRITRETPKWGESPMMRFFAGFVFLLILVPVSAQALIRSIAPGKHRLEGEISHQGSQHFLTLNSGTSSAFRVKLKFDSKFRGPIPLNRPIALSILSTQECYRDCLLQVTQPPEELFLTAIPKQYSGVIGGK